MSRLHKSKINVNRSCFRDADKKAVEQYVNSISFLNEVTFWQGGAARYGWASGRHFNIDLYLIFNALICGDYQVLASWSCFTMKTLMSLRMSCTLIAQVISSFPLTFTVRNSVSPEIQWRIADDKVCHWLPAFNQLMLFLFGNESWGGYPWTALPVY